MPTTGTDSVQRSPANLSANEKLTLSGLPDQRHRATSGQRPSGNAGDNAFSKRRAGGGDRTAGGAGNDIWCGR
jgi:hypothetical protein